MTDRSRVTIRLAAVQAQSLPGQIEASLDHAAGSWSFPGLLRAADFEPRWLV